MSESVASYTQSAIAQLPPMTAENLTDHIADTRGADLLSLIQEHGITNVMNAIHNAAASEVGRSMTELSDECGLCESQTDTNNAAIQDAVDENMKPTTPEAQSAVDQLVKDMFRQLMEKSSEEAEEASQPTGSSGKSEGAGKNGGSGAQHWLVAIAEALGKIAGEHLKNMVKYANEMNALAEGEGESANLSDEDKAAKMTAINAKMQAEAQMFKIASEAIATVTKSIGEGISSVARKQ